MSPEKLKYAESHEWVDSSTGEAVIGISAFAVEQLNDLVFMALPSVGRKLKAGEEFGEVESVKAVSPLYSPISGEVVAVNTDLPQQLENLSSDPYGKGWMIKVRPTDPSELNKLLDHAAYTKQCADGSH